MLQEERALLADQMEDIGGVTRQSVMLQRLMRGVVQIKPVNGCDLHEVALGHDALDHEDILARVDAELGGEHAAMLASHARINLQANDFGKLALTQG